MVDVGGVAFDPVTETQVLDVVAQGWARAEGGLVVTPNVDIWLRVRRDPSCQEVLDRARLVVADGMPLIWASRLAGTPLPERVPGAGLVETLSALAASRGGSVFVLGGGAGDVAERAARALAARHTGLRVAGVASPAFGFEHDPALTRELVEQVRASGADLVLIGLGFPKQERLGLLLQPVMPAAWLLGCGGAVAMAAGDARRTPVWAQRLGAEWLVRLAQEPTRLARRYLIDDIPAALSLLGMSVLRRFRR
jgi:N-acetylglucosaminyldiphosphoundecaprenol N-acetyl-beta-D-mannosaminyltransferase